MGRNRRASPSASEAVTTAGTPPATIQAAFVSPATPPANTKPAWSTPPRPPILQAALQPHPARPYFRPPCNPTPLVADGGGSNGCRPRLWKARLQTQVADGLGLAVTVCHYPTGASHYNPIEHRLFGPISINWAGKPQRSLPLLLACIRGTRRPACRSKPASTGSSTKPKSK